MAGPCADPASTYPVALGISYDGTGFNGWQTQPDHATVQDVLEDALARFVTQPVATICAGRTDAGVHATAQVVSIEAPCKRAMSSWVRGVNSMLPPTIAVRWAKEVDHEFHARFSARARTYTYCIWNDPVRSPVHYHRAGWVFRPLNEKAMQEAAQYLLGEHDFTSFRAAECQAATPVRTVEKLTVERRGQLVLIQITANAFLQHMVRNIVGSLVYVGVGRHEPAWMGKILAARSRAVAAPTFDASGLYFTGVRYPQEYGLPTQGPSPF